MINGNPRHYPMRPSTNSSALKPNQPKPVPEGWITPSTIVNNASAFDIILGVPAFKRLPRPLRARLCRPFSFFQPYEYESNHSYYAKGILYLTPNDYKVWVLALEHERRLKNASQT